LRANAFVLVVTTCCRTTFRRAAAKSILNKLKRHPKNPVESPSVTAAKRNAVAEKVMSWLGNRVKQASGSPVGVGCASNKCQNPASFAAFLFWRVLAIA